MACSPKASPLWCWTRPGGAELRQRLAAGELDRLAFRAVTFRAEYPNRNYLRFREHELPAFAQSFNGVPFLRDHNVREIAARGGTVVGSLLNNDAFMQTIELTVPRDIEAFLNGQIDRFSISWNWQGITCSVCGADWLGVGCPHWPGERVKVRDQQGQESETVCELIFEGPKGREVSAVNAPAVTGTGVDRVLAELGVMKEHGAMTEEVKGLGSEINGGVSNGKEPHVAEVAELLAAQRQVVLDAKLSASGLPGELQQIVRDGLPAAWSVAELDARIASARVAWAKLEEERTVTGMVPRGGSITGMLTGKDQLQLALDGLLAGAPA